MNIAFVTLNDWAPWGGSEMLWAGAAKRLVADGNRVAVNIRRWESEPEPIRELARLGCQVFRRPGVDAWTQKIAKRIPALAPRIEALQYRWIEAFQPDLLVVSLGLATSGLAWLKGIQHLAVPYVLIVQSAAEGHWPLDRERDIFRTVYQKALHCFFVSEANWRLVEKQLALPISNGKVIRNPYQVSHESHPEWPEENGVWKLACVGRLDVESKGQDLLLEVLRQEKWKNRNLEVTLFGAGHQEQCLRDLQQMWQIHSLKFGGQVQDIESLWSRFHGLILPSRFEGLPLAIVEALLCGRICITTQVAGNPEMVEDNVTGFIAEAPTGSHLDEALERAWSRRTEWRQMGSQAAVIARSRIPPDPVGCFVTEIKNLAGAPTAPRRSS